MDKAELLSEFKARVDQFARYTGFIEKTRQQSDKFAPAVVEKVIRDNSEKRDEVVAELVPLSADMDGVVADLEKEREGILGGQRGSRLALEEAELRLAIGELTDEEFKTHTQDLRDELDKGDQAIAGIDEELGRFQGELERWRTLAAEAGVVAGGGHEVPELDEDDDEPIYAAKPSFREEDLVQISDVSEVESVDILEPDADVEAEEIDVHDLEVEGFQEVRGEGVRFEQVHQVDDVSMVFADEEENGSHGGPAAIKLDVGDIDTLVDEELEGGAEDAAADRPRRAVMLYQEGTAEEQIYPFTGEVMSRGRGRDNDVPVKNDSKVSRYHCKLYRRGPNFYIEDNKSANGTLVNGELITERRLFGGEEVIIGETFFRFRILD